MKKLRELSYKPKKRPYGDIEPNLSYSSKQKRERNKILKYSIITLGILVFLVLLAFRFHLVASCASANGFYERYNCGHDKCCFTEPYHDPNKAWQD